jgi:hypothetical protein
MSLNQPSGDGLLDGQPLQADADRYSDMKIRVDCRKCGSAGLIPWEQLDRILVCRRCSTWYRAERNELVEVPQPQEARIQVQVRSHSSGWRNHVAIIVARLPFFIRLRTWILDRAKTPLARWMVAFVVFLVVTTCFFIVKKDSVPPPPLELPVALEDRAALFAECLLRRDTERLNSMTDPIQERTMRIWLARGSGVPAKIPDQNTEIKTKILGLTRQGNSDECVNVKVSVEGSDGEPKILDQQWIERDGKWYFQPPRLKTARPRGPIRQNKRLKG